METGAAIMVAVMAARRTTKDSPAAVVQTGGARARHMRSCNFHSVYKLMKFIMKCSQIT